MLNIWRLICPAQPFRHPWCCTYSVFTTAARPPHTHTCTRTHSHTQTSMWKTMSAAVLCIPVVWLAFPAVNAKHGCTEEHSSGLVAFFSFYFFISCLCQNAQSPCKPRGSDCVSMQDVLALLWPWHIFEPPFTADARLIKMITRVASWLRRPNVLISVSYPAVRGRSFKTVQTEEALLKLQPRIQTQDHMFFWLPHSAMSETDRTVHYVIETYGGASGHHNIFASHPKDLP